MKDYRTCETCIGPACPYNAHCGEVMETENKNRILEIRLSLGMITKEEFLAEYKEV